MKAGNLVTWGLIGVLALLAAPGVINLLRGPAPTPGVFDEGLSLETALARSEESGDPVFVLVTADWCAPCQTLKRGALSDEGVSSWIRERTIPVYLEHGADSDVIAKLPVEGFPTTLVMLDGEIVGGFSGAPRTGDYLERVRALVPERPSAP